MKEHHWLTDTLVHRIKNSVFRFNKNCNVVLQLCYLSQQIMIQTCGNDFGVLISLRGFVSDLRLCYSHKRFSTLIPYANAPPFATYNDIDARQPFVGTDQPDHSYLICTFVVRIKRFSHDAAFYELENLFT